MKNMKKRILTLLLSAALIVGLTACGGSGAAETAAPVEEEKTEAAQQSQPTQEETPAERTAFSIAALKGPTAMGLVKLMEESQQGGQTANDYTFTLAGAADEVTPLLIKGELDMACVPANLAAVLYQKTGGQMEVLAVNTLGVLYIVETGETVQSIADLGGKTVVAAGKGSTPEYALRYLLQENGLDPEKDVTVEWKSEHAECVAALASGSADIALLPQPFVTVAQGKIEGLRMALDLTQEWEKLENGSALLTGVIVARRDAVEGSEEAVSAFLDDYARSVAWVNASTEDAAALIGGYGIVEQGVAQKALPYCNIVCLRGAELREKLSGYLRVLYEASPESVGGALPKDDFYFDG